MKFFKFFQRKAEAEVPRLQTPLGKSLADSFSIMRADWLVQTQGILPKFEDILMTSPEAFFDCEEHPRSVLFISQRWDDTLQPDPTGRKADAIREFLKHCERFGSNPDNLDRETSTYLLRHGAFQAAYFVSRAKFFGESPDSTFEDEIRFDPELPLLKQVGVWFDYSCLPQDGISEKLKENLSRIDELIYESTILILRYPEDDYEKRAWCAVEISGAADQIGRVAPKPLVLRLDRIGETISKLNASERCVSSSLGLRDEFGTAQVIRKIFETELPEHEEYNEDFDTFTIKRPPYVFEGLRDFLIAEINGISNLSQTDEMLNSMGVADADFGHDMEEMVKRWLVESNLKTSNERDLVYTGLMILYLRRRGLPETSQFYRTLLERHLAGKSLKIRRYREIRRGWGASLENSCWWLFSDAPPGKGLEPNWISGQGNDSAAEVSAMVCASCGEQFDPSQPLGCSFHTKVAELKHSTGPQFDYADIYEFPCCGRQVLAKISADGRDIPPPQYPGCQPCYHST